MFTKSLTAAAVVICGLSYAPCAVAGDVMVGVFAHDVEIAGIGGAKGKETGEAIALEYRFDSPDVLDVIWSPKPYIYVSGNLNSNTSHAGAGLAWKKKFSDRFFGGLAFGLSGHDGEKRVPNPADVCPDDVCNAGFAAGEEAATEIARRFELKNNTIEFGSDVLFRTQLSVGYEWSDEWATELVYEHLSNGRIIGGPENEGLDNIGLRLAYRY